LALCDDVLCIKHNGEDAVDTLFEVVHILWKRANESLVNTDKIREKIVSDKDMLPVLQIDLYFVELLVNRSLAQLRILGVLVSEELGRNGTELAASKSLKDPADTCRNVRTCKE
jgi:hypothetical protein